jgi:hypothetical protein
MRKMPPAPIACAALDGRLIKVPMNEVSIAILMLKKQSTYW